MLFIISLLYFSSPEIYEVFFYRNDLTIKLNFLDRVSNCIHLLFIIFFTLSLSNLILYIICD